MPDEILLSASRIFINLGIAMLFWSAFGEINDLKKEIKDLKKQNYLIKWAKQGKL